ncbi:MAG: biotin/lipoyl-containing protein, partial [Verrucomicrobiota bacterium]
MAILIDVPIPSMGATVNEMTLIDLIVDAGKLVEKGEKLAELESDKSVFDFEAPCDGIIKEIFCRAGDILEVGTPFFRIETEDTSLEHMQVSEGEKAVKAVESVAPLETSVMQEIKPVASIAQVETAVPAVSSVPLNGVKWTPRAKKIALEKGVDPSSVSGIVGTGPGNRVTGEDIESWLASGNVASTGSAVQVDRSAASNDQTVCVAGIGYAVPKQARSNEEILKEFPGKTSEEIVKVTGIQQRYVIGEGESATSLASQASNHALAMAGLKVTDIDAVIVATLLPDQPVPGAASDLAKALGIGQALAFDLNAACSGWLYALEVGRSFIQGGTAKNALVVTAEILSSITNSKDHETAFLFGDGAGAAVLTPDRGGHRFYR